MGTARALNRGRLAAGLILAALVAGGSQGCSKATAEDPNGRTATGTITYQGKAVAGALVTFRSASESAFGQTDAEGKYKLRTGKGEKVPLGAYQVSVVKQESSAVAATSFNPDEYVPPEQLQATPAAAPKDLLPAKYGDAAKSNLTATVTADGKNEFDFALSD